MATVMSACEVCCIEFSSLAFFVIHFGVAHSCSINYEPFRLFVRIRRAIAGTKIYPSSCFVGGDGDRNRFGRSES